MKRLYSAEHMARGVQAVAKLQMHVMRVAPMSAGPLAALAPPPPAPGAEPVELLEAHCHGCKEKKTFQPEGSEVMKNGAIRKHGTAVCGHRVSIFTKAVKDV